ncbi:hypothetical protein [Clostridium massiliamazoniense]|uniref:hypothetical protein n=1 Tax=Clostridium massiliamazoniense TaxID=1347366 RepID=UPI0006D79451|nr:hypothetical protein [Clostridium massiliamazoniense]
MHSDFENIKISSSLKNRIKEEYKEEKKKPQYKLRKALNYEIEVPKVIIAALLIVAVMTPAIESVNKMKDLTYYKIKTTEVGEKQDNFSSNNSRNEN